MLHKMHLKKDDLVFVIAGKEKGKQGKVLKINYKKGTAIVEKINFVKRHMRPNTQNRLGGIIEKEAPLYFSKLMVVCDRCNKPVRVKHKLLETGKSKRVCGKCGELIDKK